ncbi:MAG: hypothetical protein AAGI88_18185 [Pseudomonadota bacterium]
MNWGIRETRKTDHCGPAFLPDLLNIEFNEPASTLVFCGGLLFAVSVDALNQRFAAFNQRWREKPNSPVRLLVSL